MSTSKVIFTYKRKCLSSRSGVKHADVCTDFSLDIQAGKQPNVLNKKVKFREEDLLDVCHGKTTSVSFPSAAIHDSGRLEEKYDIQRSDKLLGCNAFKSLAENISGVASLGETTIIIEKDSCLLRSRSLDVEGYVNGASDSELMEKKAISPFKQSYLCENEVAKGKTMAPLRTFSRRVKKKQDACGTGLFTAVSLGEGDTAIKECNFVSKPSFACEVTSNNSKLVEKSVDLVEENNDAGLKIMVCHSSENMISSKGGNSVCPCRQSHAKSPILRRMEETSSSREDVAVGTSPIKQTTNWISESVSPNFHNPDALERNSHQKDEVKCSLNDGAVVSSCNISSKKDKQPMSTQLQAFSGDSQITSSESSVLKQCSPKRMEHSALSNSLDLSRPLPGAFVIDCNVVPDVDVYEDALDNIQESSAVRESKIVMSDGHKKSNGRELFEDKSVHLEESPDGVHTLSLTETKHDSKYLQLFSEDGKCGQLTLSSTRAEINQSPQLVQSNSTDPTALGLSLPTGQKYEGQTSKDGATLHQFQNANVRICDLIQNPRAQSITDQASLRHKLLLESINTRATSLRGNRNISLDKFEPCPAVWSEEELDSLWIGIRRYGKGHWRAMLLDPRLRFAPWRVAGELEEQWEREQYKLFSGQHMPSSNRYLKPQDAYKLHCHGAAVCNGTIGRREIAGDTQLSLGDLYAQKDPVSFQNNAQRLATMASCGPGSYGCSPFNNVQASFMSRVDASPDGPAMAFGMNNCLPHWLRGSINASRSLDLPQPPSLIPPSLAGHRVVHPFPGTSGTSCTGKNVMNYKLAEANPAGRSHCSSLSTIKPTMADKPIVIDSDPSSEETISDDHNAKG